MSCDALNLLMPDFSGIIPDSMTMLGQRWYSVVRLAYGWGWRYNVGPTLPQR